MNLSKKTIKHILRILDDKCIEVPTKTSAYGGGGHRILTRDFEPKVLHGMNCWQRVVYVPSEGYFYGIYNGQSEEDWCIPDIWSPAQLTNPRLPINVNKQIAKKLEEGGFI